MAPPHTEASIRAIYAPLAEGDFKTYMEHVADNVDWVIGNPDLKTFPPAGRWDKKGFMAAIAPLGQCFPGPLKLEVMHVLVSQDGKRAAVELKADEVGKDGTVFKNYYCWMNEFNEQGTIVAVRAYLDTALVKQLMEANGQA